MRADAAIMRRRAQRAAHVGTQRQRPHPRGERRRRAARGSPRRPANVPGVVGRSVDGVVALPVAERQRHIGLAKDHGARLFQAGDDQGVLLWPKILELRIAPSRRQTGDVEGLLHRHRNSEQCAFVAARERDVGRLGRLARALEVADDDRVDPAIDRLDSGDRLLQQLGRGNPPSAERSRELSGREEVPFRRRKGRGRRGERPARPGRGRADASMDQDFAPRTSDLVHPTTLPAVVEAPAERDLAHGAFDVERESRHLAEEVDVAGADRASAELHVGRDEIKGLHQNADVLENQ